MTEKTKSDLNLDRFEKWHNLISDYIQDFLTTLPESTRSKLDYSMDSLSVVGNWLVEQYPDDGPDEIHRGVIYYVGEVYRKYLEGHWNIHFKTIEPDFEYGEEPVIEGFHHDVVLCPFFEVLITLSKKNGERLRNILMDFMKLYKSKREM